MWFQSQQMSFKRLPPLVLFGLAESVSAQSPHFSDLGIVGDRGVWPFLLYLGFLIFLGGSLYTKQTEFYAWTIYKQKSPFLYWCIIFVLTSLAVCFAWCLWKYAA